MTDAAGRDRTTSSAFDRTLDQAMESLDPNTRQMLMAAADAWARERHGTPPDKINLLNDEQTPQGRLFEVEISAAGILDHIGLLASPNGEITVQPAE
jgi:hypothetical protein